MERDGKFYLLIPGGFEIEVSREEHDRIRGVRGELVTPPAPAHKPTPLEVMADQRIRSEFAIRAVRFSQLNPEQQLAYMLEQVVEVTKGKLALMQALLPLSEACVAWRKTPEGVAWMEKMAAKRAAAETKGKQP